MSKQSIGAKCSSAVKTFAHGVMGRRIDPSWWTHYAISHSSQCSTIGETNIVVCVILSVGYSERVAHVAAACFLSRYLNGPLPYVQCHITVNKMC